MNQAQMILAIEDLTKRVAALEAAKAAARDRGPKSGHTMTEKDAFRVKHGDHKDSTPKVAAAALGLSYGQVFSCRGGYTFKQVKADWKEPVAAPATTSPTEAVKQ